MHNSTPRFLRNALVVAMTSAALVACSENRPDDRVGIGDDELPPAISASEYEERTEEERQSLYNGPAETANLQNDDRSADRTNSEHEQAVEVARATLSPTEGFNATGTVRFISQQDGVAVQATLEGLDQGRHGIHIHENGDCSAADASSAGGHFTPQNDPHGAPGDPASERHRGDLGNLRADANGEAEYNRADDQITLTGENSIIGKALIVHAEPDDLSSQPSGDAGERVACGVITEVDNALAQN